MINDSLEWILDPKNIEWIFGGIGVTILGALFKPLLSFLNKDDPSNKNNNTNDNSQKVVINNNFADKARDVFKKSERSVPTDIPHDKDSVKILFIDDDTTFKIIDILKKSGWKNTSIVKDVEDVDSLEVKNTHIFFIDIKGVALWLSKKHQGLALASKIKDKYPEKVVIIYSSDTRGDRSHEALQKVDWFLPKDAEPADFFSVIEKFTTA